MTTHVFIVDKTTFKLHLEYLFAGTGAGDSVVDFNNSQRTRLHHATENNLLGMIADFQRIRRGDFIIFYVQKDGLNEGRFFGIFRAKYDLGFLDNNDGRQFLKRELQKSLTFRTLIKPYKVYSNGVTEWQALDTIRGLASYQIIWSLIYRKLKATRGNTMITIYEAERLMQLIRNENNRTELNHQNKVLSFDPKAQKIVCLSERPRNYTGRRETINIFPRLLKKYRDGQAFESHLQAYVVENLGRNTNQSLDACLIDNLEIEWLGNEVYCGVGMQRIDVMPSVVKDSQRILIPIELKAVEADEKIVIQIKRYVDWIEQYYIPNRQSDIQPVLIAKKIINKQSGAYQKLIDSFSRFNQDYQNRCASLKFIEFEATDNDLIFAGISY